MSPKVFYSNRVLQRRDKKEIRSLERPPTEVRKKEKVSRIRPDQEREWPCKNPVNKARWSREEQDLRPEVVFLHQNSPLVLSRCRPDSRSVLQLVSVSSVSDKGNTLVSFTRCQEEPESEGQTLHVTERGALKDEIGRNKNRSEIFR